MSTTIERLYALTRTDEGGLESIVCTPSIHGLSLVMLAGEKSLVHFKTMLPLLRKQKPTQLVWFDRVGVVTLEDVPKALPETPAKFETMYAFLALEPSGEGIMGSTTLRLGYYAPLVVGDPGSVHEGDELAQDISKLSGRDYHIVQFKRAGEE